MSFLVFFHQTLNKWFGRVHGPVAMQATLLSKQKSPCVCSLMPSVLRKDVFFERAKLQLNSANKETLYMYVNNKKTESHII